jgi:CspA family cold shock protein
MNGKVKFFNENNGYGFIIADDGKEYFVHSSGLAEGVRITENDEVNFNIVQSDRGPKADDVKLGSADSSSQESEASDDE